MSVERVAKKLNRLTEQTGRRLDDLERAVGRLNTMFVTLRAANLGGSLDENPNGSERGLLNNW